MNPVDSQIKLLPSGVWVLQEDTHISRWVEERGTLKCDPALFEWLAPRLDGCQRAWDVGAFIGDHTRFYLDAGLDVCAFEPNPVAFECLKRNCPEAFCYNVAASDAEHFLGWIKDRNVGASRLTGEGGLRVPGVRLDDLTAADAPPDYVKIDAEGWEPKVLAGMQETLREAHPKLFIEFNRGALERNQTTLEALKAQLVEYGYRRFDIWPPNAAEGDPQYDLFCV